MLYGVEKREIAWQRVPEHWDVIVIGGGITGASILREAARAGLKVLLLEQNDFASGSSSRSSKLVHGGLRYLNNLQIGLTWRSVHERETLLKGGEGLISSLPFLFPVYDNDRMPAWMFEFGLYLYGWMGGQWHAHEKYTPDAVKMLVPDLVINHLIGAFRFYDALTDDVRLVLRVIQEGINAGDAVAINYACVERLIRDDKGSVTGITARDRVNDEVYEIRGTAIINATGAWADMLREQMGIAPRIRPLRGSHLIFRQEQFPLYQAVSFPHPDDGRPVFAFPWEGVTLLGTTDIDHDQSLDEEPAISPEEISYLLRAVQDHFPGLDITESDVMASFAGVRPVIDHGSEVKPSEESRKHVLWDDNGLLTITGGKLTTFHCMALDVLKMLQNKFPHLQVNEYPMNALDPLPDLPSLPPGLTYDEAKRLMALYGSKVFDLEVSEQEWERVNGLNIHWMEFRWAARYEAVIHLDDLLLRRVRIGLLVPDGGRKYLPYIRKLVQAELGWDDARWKKEEQEYMIRWRTHYRMPTSVKAK